MSKKNKEKKTKNKQKKKFRLVILDDLSLKQYYTLSLTKGNLFIYLGTSVIIIGFLIALLFIFTPLKYVLPPVDNYKLENEVIKNSILADSLKREIAFRDNYFEQIQNIINGVHIDKFESTDTATSSELLSKKQQDSIMNILIKREQESMKQIMSDEKIDVKKDNFYVPLQGVISNKFDPSKSHYGVDIVAQEGTPVIAIQEGTVILATWSVNTGYVIEIQHPNNLISVYKHNGELLKKEGDKVKAGEPIALVGNSGEQTTGPHLHFEMWHNGVPVDPEKYLNF
jgi:murein DD-endopeptidase MepM/ murein hydrolase activator NlpD